MGSFALSYRAKWETGAMIGPLNPSQTRMILNWQRRNAKMDGSLRRDVARMQLQERVDLFMHHGLTSWSPWPYYLKAECHFNLNRCLTSWWSLHHIEEAWICWRAIFNLEVSGNHNNLLFLLIKHTICATHGINSVTWAKTHYRLHITNFATVFRDELR